jgi:hypothetical protein
MELFWIPLYSSNYWLEQGVKDSPPMITAHGAYFAGLPIAENYYLVVKVHDSE